ncbi:MAG: amino acid ABC transporter ATP-binding protein [Desulfobacterales bacterium]|nr:amino acid ABC transporter ATP-binding protein [Desulfobacterales bacterium]
MIQVKNLHKRFGDLSVLRGVDLEVPQRQVQVIIGPSGSGKSTLLRCINHLEPPSDGEIWLDGELVNDPSLKRKAFEAHLNRIRCKVGMVFQQFNLFPHMTVMENVIEAPVHVLHEDPGRVRSRAEALLDKVGLQEKVDAYPDMLSGGQQQRVAIARALAMEPKAMLFDEVTSALDPELVGDVLRVMENLARDGMTMMVVTHEMGFAEKVGDRVIFMADGNVVEDAAPKEMFGNPKKRRTRQFLSEILK